MKKNNYRTSFTERNDMTMHFDYGVTDCQNQLIIIRGIRVANMVEIIVSEFKNY
ncbi:hypothetical protein DES39_0360 [Orbus hercynius]|uniref:Uncharacterized protein n=1 Tax=Orbus hercynius TaxID=593135 RepID=A0A495RI95_9GAMM|nr:hypothetical protein DES39_0360 [Orbus hercynius]